MHEVLVNCLFKLAQEKTDRSAMTSIAVDLGCKATQQTNNKNKLFDFSRTDGYDKDGVVHCMFKGVSM